MTATEVGAPETTRTIWYTRCPSPTASSVALGAGWLEQEFVGSGIALRSLADSPDRSVRQSHFTQEQSEQFRHGGIVPPLWARSRGAPITLLGVNEIPRLHAVIALGDRGPKDPSDLRGARLGVPRRTSEPVDFWRAHSLRALSQALAVAGIASDEVKWVDLPTDEPYHGDGARRSGSSLWTAREAARLQRPEVLALVRGEVDAIYTYAPTGLGLIELLGAHTVLTLPVRGAGSSGTGSLSVLTVGSAVLDRDPQVAVTYLAGLLRASEWAAERPGEAVRIFAAEEGVPEEWAAATFDPPPGSVGLDLRPSLSAEHVGALQAEADFLFSAGFLATAVDVAAWADHRPLTEARERVAASANPAKRAADLTPKESA